MSNLKKILLVGSVLLAGCNDNGSNRAVLTSEDFAKAKWISVPYSGEIWNSYKGEEVEELDTNWTIYKNLVAKKNRFEYVEKEGVTYIVRVKGKEILLPDLNKDGYVVIKKNKIINLIELATEEDSDIK